MTKANSRIADVAVLVLGGGLFLALALQAVVRPLWIDEVMAMVNYPLAGLSAMFDPLPHYSQAAPPLFNVIISAIANLDPVVIRVVLLLIISACVLVSVTLAFPAVWVPGAVLLSASAISTMIPLWTEMKYYGLEVAGVAIILAWVVKKDGAGRFTVRDLVLLMAAACFGISSMVIAVVALLTHLALRRRDGSWPSPGEALRAAILLAFVAAYYLAIKHGTRLQIATYPDEYNVKGVSAVFMFIKSTMHVAGYAFLPLAALAIAVNLLDVRAPRTQRLILFSVLTMGAFGALAFVGAYPARSARHVAWAGAFYIFFVVNAVWILLGSRGERLRLSWRTGAAAAVAAIAVLAAARPVYRELVTPDAFVNTDNGRVLAWLRSTPPQSVGVWIGAQPVIEYYRKAYPEIGKHRYFGFVTTESVSVSPDLISPGFLSQDVADVSRTIEAKRAEPGGWARGVVYRLLRNFDAPARTLLAQAPASGTFYILVSHADFNATDPLEVARNTALKTAIAERKCDYAVEFEVRKAYLLKLSCSAAPQ